MNKLVLFVLVYCLWYVPILSNTPSEDFVVINIPDANFKQALINLGVDTNGDSEIEDTEALLINGLNLSSQNISDLTGIEAFLNITYLNVSDNNLSSIDLSLNTNLSILYCSDNNLTTLNVSHLSLAELRCADNDITALDVSLSTTLTHLYCQNNMLTALDVTNNLDLQYFSCRNNLISTLDLSGQTDLVIANFAQTSISSIDVSSSTNLEHLVGYQSELASIDVANNTALQIINMGSCEISGGVDLSAHLALEEVYLNNNNLTSLNIANGNNTSLVSFFTAGNDDLHCITVDDIAYAENQLGLTNWGKGVGTIYSLDCSVPTQVYVPDDNFEQALIDQGIDSNGILDDYILLGEALTIQNLNISNLNISDLTGIASFDNLLSLNFSDNTVTTADLSNNSLLYSLNGSRNTLTSVNVNGNAALQYLSLNNNSLATLNVSALTNLLQIGFARNEVSSIDVSLSPNLIHLIGNNNELSALDVSNNLVLEIINMGTNEISGSFDVSAHTVLEQLYINTNQLTSLDVANGNNTSLVSFYAASNPDLHCITVDDVSYAENQLGLTNWGKGIGSIYSLDCSVPTLVNVPDDAFEQALIDLGIDGNPVLDDYILLGEALSVQDLDISNQTISDLTGIEAFDNLLSLDFSDNNVTTADFSNNTELYSLSGSNNSLTSVTINSNAALQYVYLNNNSLGTLDVSALTNLLQIGFAENTLSSIDVSLSPNLIHLIGYDNQFSSIDVSANLLLEIINMGDNQITGLDLSGHTALSQLYLGDNNLTSLNVSNGNNTSLIKFHAGLNTDLHCISVDDIAYAETQEIAGDWGKGNGSIYSVDCSIPTLVYVPDDNFEQALIDLGIDSSGILDDNILLGEALSVNSLNVSLLGINDLTGIEAFANLVTLRARNNNLTTIDVSQNVLLNLLYIHNNNLSSLSVSANGTLDYLNIRNNNISTLDLSNNGDLLQLYCDGNALTTLDVSNNNNLEYLYINDNSISIFDTSALTNLIELGIPDNPISVIDVTNSPSLEVLIAYNSNLSDLDITNNLQLTYLNLYNNNLTALRLSQHTALTNVNVGLNDMQELSIVNGNNANLVEFVTNNNTNLSCIEVDNVAFADSQALAGTWVKDAGSAYSINCGYPPFITLTGANPQTIEEGVGYTELGATTDDGSTVVIDATDFVDAIGTYTILYNATDAFGNNAIQVTRTVDVVDLTAPIITLTGANPQTIEQGAGYSELGATTDDGSSVVIDATDFVDAVGSYTILYNATDAYGNNAIQVTRTVDVVDTTAPIITLTGANPQTIEQGVGYIELGATTDDASSVVIDATDFVDAVGSYTILYDATDAYGNNAIQVTRTVDVVDTTAPIITLTGANPQTIEEGVGYSELGATTDDGSSVVIDATDFVDAIGTYTILYNATDAYGNNAIQVTRTVDVVDTTAPIITLTGANPQTIEQGAGYSELGATTDDGSSVVIDASDFVDTVGSYTILYNATDASGNLASQVTRTVNVVDTTAPIITLTGANPQTIELGAGYTELGATTDDGSSVAIDITNFSDAIGTYIILYNATDNNGNIANEVSRTINVIENAVDTTAPIITLTGANPQIIELGVGYTELGATTDDGSLVSIDATNFVDAVGTYAILYNATDVNGNIATEVTRTVIVVDTTAPIITLTGANPQIIELGVGYTELGATTDDGSTVLIDNTNFVDAVGTYAIRYNATDTFGNIASEVTRTINVTTIVDEEELTTLRLYPNPIIDQFVIEGVNSNSTSIYIFDIGGNLIHQIKNYEPQQFIDISNLSAGVYYVRVFIDNKMKTQKRIIKK